MFGDNPNPGHVARLRSMAFVSLRTQARAGRDRDR
jgi:hypothetical protein